MIITLESSETIYRTLDARPRHLKQKIKKESCTICNQQLKDKEKIDFIELSDGSVRWWHHRDFVYGKTCKL